MADVEKHTRGDHEKHKEMLVKWGRKLIFQLFSTLFMYFQQQSSQLSPTICFFLCRITSAHVVWLPLGLVPCYSGEKIATRWHRRRMWAPWVFCTITCTRALLNREREEREIFPCDDINHINAMRRLQFAIRSARLVLWHINRRNGRKCVAVDGEAAEFENLVTRRWSGWRV